MNSDKKGVGMSKRQGVKCVLAGDAQVRIARAHAPGKSKNQDRDYKPPKQKVVEPFKDSHGNMHVFIDGSTKVA